VPRECVGDRHDAPHEANLFDINAKYGDVLPKADVLAYLRSL
jgi:maleamate amidohydrolase